MDRLKTISEWMKDLDVEITQLVECSELDKKVIEAIVSGRYTTSPTHRLHLSNALGVSPDKIQWGQRPSKSIISMVMVRSLAEAHRTPKAQSGNDFQS